MNLTESYRRVRQHPSFDQWLTLLKTIWHIIVALTALVAAINASHIKTRAKYFFGLPTAVEEKGESK